MSPICAALYEQNGGLCARKRSTGKVENWDRADISEMTTTNVEPIAIRPVVPATSPMARKKMDPLFSNPTNAGDLILRHMKRRINFIPREIRNRPKNKGRFNPLTKGITYTSQLRTSLLILDGEEQERDDLPQPLQKRPISLARSPRNRRRSGRSASAGRL
ncbi:unnamed protein product [Nesidiocoris tenuis]|uniref:Uncharacterized protein n=1 Tax=Nesidiocoris tenuis TaxID=355587 RepID=A0A6H5GZY2_9HEMI|nr:unnamed protein product [Nesidiocoris tenuis]